MKREYDPDWGNFHDRQFDPPDEEEDDEEDTWDEWTADDEWKRRREDPDY